MATPDNNEVEYNILIEATIALKNLADLTSATSSFNQKILETTEAVKSASKQWGVSFEEAKAQLRGLDESLSGTAQSSVVFGGAGQAAWEQVGEASIKAGEDVEKSSKLMVGGIDIVRLALRFALIGALFEVVNAFRQMFSTAIDNLRKMELATNNLVDAERRLSGAGVEITPKDLDSFIKKIQQLDPLVSKLEASQAVSDTASRLGATLKLSKEQMDSFIQSMTILAVRGRALGKDFNSVFEEGVSSLLSGRVSRGLNDLGANINDSTVKIKAVQMGLVASADAFDKLTGEAKKYVQVSAEIALLQDSTKDTVSHLPDAFKGADAAFGIFQAKLTNVLTTIGTDLTPLIIKVLTTISDWLQKLNDFLTKNQDAVLVYVEGFTALLTVAGKLVELFLKLGTAIGWGIGLLSKVIEKIQQIIDKHPGLKKVVDLLSKITPDIGSSPDTPTNLNPPPNSDQQQQQADKIKMVQETEQKLQNVMQESADKKADIEREYGQKLQDIATNYSQKLEDIATQTAQKREDALRDYGQKVDDINRDAAQKIADAQREWRQKEIDKQKEFQNKMKELRDKFLFDLEDALHERDARQVLRLIRQYNLDKKHLEDQSKLDRQQAKKDLAAKLQDIEIERQRKLEAAQREYQDKLQQIAIGEARARAEAQLWQQRALADANTWHQRQLQEQQQYLQRKLRDLANAIMQEYNLTAQGAQAVYSMLNGYFGTGGMASNLLSGFGASLGGGTSTSSGPGTQVGASPGIGSGLYNPYDVRTPRSPYFGHAEGGTLVATRPTQALFGENGPEIVSFTPLTRPGNDMGKIFGDKSALGGMGGDMKIRLELSPDLEARIIDSSMENVAVHIERIDRSK